MLALFILYIVCCVFVLKLMKNYTIIEYCLSTIKKEIKVYEATLWLIDSLMCWYTVNMHVL